MSNTASVPMDSATMVALWYELEDAVSKVQLYFAALCCIVFYEYLSNFSREYRLILKADWTLIKTAYILIRYTGIAHAIIDLYAYYGLWKAEECARFVTFIPAFPIIGVVLSHFIMLTQCHAVWNRSHWVLIALGPLVLSEAVVMSISTFTKIVPISMMTSLGPCLPRAVDAFPIVYFAAPMVFDLAVTVLTAVKVLKLRNEDRGLGLSSSLLNTIIQQSFQYFIFITAANSVNIVYYAVDANDPMSSINGPLAIIATELFTCRLTLSLREIKSRSTVTGLGSPSEKVKRKLVKVVVLGDEPGNDTTYLPTVIHSQAPFQFGSVV